MSTLEHAILSYAMSTARKLKPTFELVSVDDILPFSTTVACGFPAPDETEHSLQYQLIDNKELCLSGTAGKQSFLNDFKCHIICYISSF